MDFDTIYHSTPRKDTFAWDAEQRPTYALIVKGVMEERLRYTAEVVDKQTYRMHLTGLTDYVTVVRFFVRATTKS